LDVNRLGTGEKIAAVSAVALLLIMFIFDWFGVSGSIDTGVGVVEFEGGGANAWQSFGFIDIVLFVTVVAAIALAVITANASDVNLPVAGSAIVAGLGILSVILILYRIIDPPSDLDREIGVFLGLIAAGGIAYGGWVAMQEEGTSFGDQRDRVSGGGPGDRGGPRDRGGPPPPPPQA
jgi:hypothetical protein